MKRISTFLIFIMIGFFLSAQSPNYFNYQAVARNNAGEILPDKNINVKISILQGSTSGTVRFSEKHSITTDKLGLVNLKIGNGTRLSGNFSTIKWGKYKHFVKVEIDVNGGSSYSHFGTSQLLSVPYALHAKTVEIDKVKDADASTTNEIQNLSLSGNDLTLSKGGGTVTLSSGRDTAVWNKSGSNVYYDAGKVSIGSNTGSNLLNINGKARNSFISFHNNATGTNLSDGLTIGTKTNKVAYLWNCEAAPLNIGTGNTLRMHITANGKVGIGNNTAPIAPLSIYGDTQNGELILQNKNTGKKISDGLRIGISSRGKDAWVFNNEAGKLYFGTSKLERLTIATNGNVGIGDNTPEAKLKVNGTVKFGNTGKVFSEIREITGNTHTTLSYITIAYPTGYTEENTRVLTLEVNYNGTHWNTQGMVVNSGYKNVSCSLGPTIRIHYPNIGQYKNKRFRLLLMKVE